MDNAHTGLGGGPQSIRRHLRGRQGSPLMYRLHKKITGPDYAAPDGFNAGEAA
jgi:hypothetical protein